MFDFLKKKPDDKSINYLCLDIGTEFLKVLAFHIADGQVHVNEYHKARQHSAAMKNGTVTSIRRVIETVMDTVSKMETKKFSGAIMGIAGELVKGVTVEARYDRPRTTKLIDKYEIDAAIEKLKDEALKEAKELVFNNIGDTTGELHNLELLNSIVVNAEIDGFRVEDPIGMTGSEAKLTIYYTFAPVLHVNYLKTVTDTIGVKLLGIVAQPFAIARAIKGGSNQDYSSIIVDIGGGTTDIAIIQNGISAGTHMIAFGSRVFTKHIASDLNLTLADAEEFKIKYSTGKLSDIRMQQVRTTVNKYTPFWALQLAIGLEEFLGIVKGFPHNLYLCGGGALLPEIKSSIIEFPWIKELPFNRHPKPEYLYPNGLSDIVDEKGLLSSIEDVTPASIARFTLEIINK